eukprot:CAMPEP_0183485708 /NCGR_PEP_ID=MMETSP0370-20130417/179564_1 /TAXON_ID=268820 /ORGANISM="Peridinium aciculiferum, Strain PAER-2" /LENGTH=465 /DNA_ID=CAMNT_0025679013 /DNA_START=18 /DNA_END=1414 /DNA_ORIENTATION=-
MAQQYADDKKVSDLIAQTKPGWFSFEYFPPKTDEGVKNLHKRINRMTTLGPLFTDFTWGAGGSTSELSLQLTSWAKNEAGTVSNMHLTCTNQKSEMCGDALTQCKKVGVRNIVALRGDPPRGSEKWEATEGGFACALDLVKFMRKERDGGDALTQCKKVGVRNIVALRGDPPRGSEKWEATEGGFACALDLVKFMRKEHGDYFSISVAGYPEGHPDNIKEVEGGLDALTPAEKRRARVAIDKTTGKEIVTVCRDPEWEIEMKYMKEKADAGAQFIITQMFMDPQVYVDYVKACKDWGINIPVVPGIMCLNNFGGLERMTELCKTRVPQDKTTGKEIVTVCHDPEWEIEMKYMKEKADAGAQFIITQMFMDPQVYVDYVKACKDWGINIPVVPGIMCLNNFGGLERMTELCKTRVPPGLLEEARAANTTDDAFKTWGIEAGVKMCRALLEGGAPGLHFYTLNLERV